MQADSRASGSGNAGTERAPVSAHCRARVIVGRVLVGEGKQDSGDSRDQELPAQRPLPQLVD